jgi:hypothetical protein
MENFECLETDITCADCETEDCPARASWYRTSEKELDPDVAEIMEILFSQHYKTKFISG